MAKVLQCIYKSWPCDDLDQVYGKVNMGCLCIWIGKTVKMSFEGKSQQEIGKWTEYWRFWKKKMAQGLICPCTGVKYHNIQTCLLVYAADLRWAFTGPLVLWFQYVKAVVNVRYESRSILKVVYFTISPLKVYFWQALQFIVHLYTGHWHLMSTCKINSPFISAVVLLFIGFGVVCGGR